MPALAHVGGRSLGDYHSAPDDHVGLLAEHFASAWQLRFVVSVLDSTFKGYVDESTAAVAHTLLKDARIQFRRARLRQSSLTSGVDDLNISVPELMDSFADALSTLQRTVADSPTPSEASSRRPGLRRQPARGCKNQHQVTPGGDWVGGVGRFQDRPSIIKAMAASLTPGELAIIAKEHSFGVDSEASINRGVHYEGIREGVERLVAQFGMPIRLFKVTDAAAVMHEIFSRDNTAPEFKGTEFEKYGDWSY
eukprot:SAG31_NODE_1057_length_10129_cov_29.441376_1_plen_250_part_10